MIQFHNRRWRRVPAFNYRLPNERLTIVPQAG